MNKRNTAFYVETLLMIVLLMVVSLLIMRIYGAARRDSSRAHQLTQAVILAENTAEYAAAAGDSAQLSETLSGQLTQQGDTDVIAARFGENMTPAEDGLYLVRVCWTEENDTAEVVISVLTDDQEIYSLETAVYTGEAVA